MKRMSLKYQILLAATSGIITAVTFPTMFGGVMMPNLGFLAWVSFVPLFVAIHNAGIRRTFGLAFITGFICYAISFYWIYNALTRYGKLSAPVSVGILFLMMVVLGAYLAVIPTWVKWFRSKWGGSALILLPVAWVAVELARNYFPAGGFPWNGIAYSQAGYPIMIQTADVFGIYGITFLIIMVNQLIATKGSSLAFSVLKQKLTRLRWSADSSGQAVSKTLNARLDPFVVTILFVITLAYGWYRMDTIVSRSPAVRAVRIALVQGNIPQDEKWNIDFLEENLAVYSDYMGLIMESDISLAIWPESSYPYVIPLNMPGLRPEKLGTNPHSKDAFWTMFGALSIDTSEDDEVLYNSAILTDNEGLIVDRYHKGHLVPFGEYVPYRKALFFAKKLVEPLGDFRTGEGHAPLSIRDEYKVAPLICFEDVFPEISREFVLNGANILINMTNDAWYGWTSAAYQHLAISVFRAVENRRYMLRATNTGVTAVIDPEGKVELESNLFERSFMVTSVPVLRGLTIYDKIGDLFAYLCALVVLVLTIIVAVRSVIRHRR